MMLGEGVFPSPKVSNKKDKTMATAPIQLGIDPDNLNRCFITVPCDIGYMKMQREVLRSMVDADPALTPIEKQQMTHLIGFLDHFIHGVYSVTAEYHTANRSSY
jgi:hypothetical protein